MRAGNFYASDAQISDDTNWGTNELYISRCLDLNFEIGLEMCFL